MKSTAQRSWWPAWPGYRLAGRSSPSRAVGVVAFVEFGRSLDGLTIQRYLEVAVDEPAGACCVPGSFRPPSRVALAERSDGLAHGPGGSRLVARYGDGSLPGGRGPRRAALRAPKS